MSHSPPSLRRHSRQRPYRPLGNTDRARKMNLALEGIIDHPWLSRRQIAERFRISSQRASFMWKVALMAEEGRLNLGGLSVHVATWDELRRAYRQQVEGHTCPSDGRDMTQRGNTT